MPTAAEYGMTGVVGAQPLNDAALLEAMRMLDARRRTETQALITCGTVGVILVSLAFGSIVEVVALVAKAHTHPVEDFRPIMLVATAACAFSLLLAAVTKPQSRADVARQFIASSARSAHSDPLVAATALTILMIALYGSYAIVEAGSRCASRWKLRRVNRWEAAELLARIVATPVGLTSHDLLRNNHRGNKFRDVVAMLILDGWIEIRDGGRVIAQRSAAQHAIHNRHPLAEVFQPEVAF